MESREDPSSAPIEALGLSIHWYHSLKRNGVHTVGQLAVLPERHLMALRHSREGTMDELKYKVARLGLSPWDAPPPTGNQVGSGATDRRPGPGQPGRLSLCALSAAAALLLPAGERARWVEEWKSELCALRSRKARARFTMSLLLEGGRELAVTLRQAQLGHKPAGR
jgi:hypothetical protein